MNGFIKKKTYLAAALALSAAVMSLGQFAGSTSASATSFSAGNDVRSAVRHQLSDANIAAIVSTAGNLDVAYGKIALSKTKNESVREFAQRMVTDHSAIQKSAEELLARLNISPEEDHISRSLAENGEKIKGRLNELSGEDFDRFYVNNEVEYHEVVVDTTANMLIPNAKNPELKATLQSVLPLFEKHLEHVRMIRSTMGNASGMAAGSAKLSDANIGAIVVVADDLDIAYGKIALEKSKNKAVKEFAQRMVTDHTAVQKAVIELAGKLGLVPEENETSRGLAENGVKVKAKLDELKGKDFDRFYIDNEVAYHDLVVKATRDLLIPNAENAELKAALIQALPLFERHLEHARSIQGKMNGVKSGHSTDMKH